MYGGRVQDNKDRRVLNCYLEEYLGPFIFDSNLEFVDAIPIFTAPGVFGLHSNAEITYFNNSAKALWANIMEMQTSDSAGAGGIDRDAIIGQIAEDIETKTLPELFDEYNIRKSFNNNISPTQTVLLQELERYNKLV